jgi:hypothetical protein
MFKISKLFFSFLICLIQFSYLAYGSQVSSTHDYDETSIQTAWDRIKSDPHHAPNNILSVLMGLDNPRVADLFLTSSSAQNIIRYALSYLETVHSSTSDTPSHTEQGICAMLISIQHVMKGDSFVDIFGEIPDVRGSDTWEPNKEP